MAMTDPIADTLARMRNAQMRRHATVECRYSRFIENVLRVFQDEGYIEGFEKLESKSGHPALLVTLRYHAGKGVIQKMWRVSRPGRRVYATVGSLGQVAGGWGVYVVSTSKGVFPCRKAFEENIGGEVVCAIL